MGSNKNVYEGHAYIKDGKIMLRSSKTVFLDSQVENKKVQEKIVAFLETNPPNITLGNIIAESVKAATGCSHFYHYKVNSNSKVKSDPLYEYFENYIKGLDLYNEILESRLEKQKQRIQRVKEGRDKKVIDKNLDSFLYKEKAKRIFNSTTRKK